MPDYRSKLDSPLEANGTKYRGDSASPLEANPLKYRSRMCSPLEYPSFETNMMIYDLVTDGTYLYLAGLIYHGSVYYARLEKRDPISFALLNSVELSDQYSGYYSCYLDGNDIYAGGYYTISTAQQMIQKRSKNNLSSLTWTFTEALAQSTYIVGITVDSSNVYGVGGYGGSSVLKNAINKGSGTKVWEFTNSSTSARGISDDGNYLFVLKQDGGYRELEKVDRTNGNVIAATYFTPSSNTFDRGVYSAGQSALYVGGTNTSAPSPQGTNFCSKITLGSPMIEIWKYDFPVAGSSSSVAAAQFYNGSIYIVGLTTVSSFLHLYIVKLADDGSTVQKTWTSPEVVSLGYNQVTFIGDTLFTAYYIPSLSLSKVVGLNRINLS